MFARAIRLNLGRLIAPALVAVLVAGCATTSPGGTGGAISGHVRMLACSGAPMNDGTCPIRPMPGVTVRVQPVGAGAVLTVKTDDAGAYSITVTPGSYDVFPEAELRRSMFSPRQVTVTPGQTVVADFTLRSGGWCNSGGGNPKMPQPECLTG